MSIVLRELNAESPSSEDSMVPLDILERLNSANSRDEIHADIRNTLGVFNSIMSSFRDTMRHNASTANFFAQDAGVHRFLETVIRFVNREIERVSALPDKTVEEMVGHLQSYVQMLVKLLTLGMEAHDSDQIQNRYQMLLEVLKSLSSMQQRDATASEMNIGTLMNIQSNVFEWRPMHVENDHAPPVANFVIRMSRMLGCNFVDYCDAIAPANFRGVKERQWVLELIKTWTGRNFRTTIEALTSHEMISLFYRMQEQWYCEDRCSHVDASLLARFFREEKHSMIYILFSLFPAINACAKLKVKSALVDVESTCDLLFDMKILVYVNARVDAEETINYDSLLHASGGKLCDVIRMVADTIESFRELLSNPSLYWNTPTAKIVKAHLDIQPLLDVVKGHPDIQPLLVLTPKEFKRELHLIRVFEGKLDKFNTNRSLRRQVAELYVKKHVKPFYPKLVLAPGCNRSIMRNEVFVLKDFESVSSAASAASKKRKADSGEKRDDVEEQSTPPPPLPVGQAKQAKQDEQVETADAI